MSDNTNTDRYSYSVQIMSDTNRSYSIQIMSELYSTYFGEY
ncbi:hypothetical protein EST35_0461 [Pseudomonas phage vB_PaeM_PA5oct]|uniref:Uncharacterized protein n=1 Tax=Pseudomonas phage vB_PaeM_PA5oct TaxID=2163605 RepID=A0A4Y5JVD3_9CAUD|nr:hypothetical protein PQE65_gp036 [Pseudomonas phage vB_PaeM_PA5oct]QCG76329.1 hypothetical protein EST35_0461 [Pseudomonas phage vB_PaeM_PA5oct]